MTKIQGAAIDSAYEVHMAYIINWFLMKKEWKTLLNKFSLHSLTLSLLTSAPW